MKPLFEKIDQNSWIAIGVIVLLIIRLYLNAAIPLMDNTEARYAEIARLMVETNNWVVPHVDYGVPFWAKPPLSTWLSALSFKMFGVNEFTARLPYFLLSLMVALMLGKYAQRQGLNFWLPALIILTIPEFFLHAGVVSTDTALTFSITLAMLSFWEVITGNRHWYWKYLFFVGIGLGLLAKGPIVLILTIPPIFMWTCLTKSHQRVWALFPCFQGILIAMAISLPWYILAEKQSPGFIDYFIIGEHFKRFFDSGWAGDKYGFPKSQPIGVIWAFLLLFALPWSPIAMISLLRSRDSILKNRWTLFLVLWLLWTPLFFTISKSLIHPYIMPAMPPLALLIMVWWKQLSGKMSIIRTALAMPFLAISLFGYAHSTDKMQFYANTDKYLLSRTQTEPTPIFHLGTKSYSGQFYSHGALQSIQIDEIEEKVDSGIPFFLIIKNRDTSVIHKSEQQKLGPIEVNSKKRIYRFD